MKGFGQLLICVTCLMMPLAQAKSEIRVGSAQEQARVHTDLASRYYQVGQVSIAVDEAKTALSSVADYVPAHTVLGLIYAQLKQNSLADTHFAAALSAAEAQKISQTDVRNSYAWYLCSSGRGEQALQEFAIVLRDPLYDSMDKALINAGACAARLNRNDLALPYLDAAVDVNANNGAAYMYRAHVLINAARYSDARADLRRADALIKNSPEVLWAQVRLAQAQNAPFKNTTDELQRDYPTSEQANWARAGRYETF